MRHLAHPLVLALAVTTALGGCSVFRKGAGEYEKAAAKNEAGQLILPNAPTEDRVTTDASSTAAAVPTTATQVTNIEQAAKNLPRGLAGDTANQQHIGEPIPPR